MEEYIHFMSYPLVFLLLVILPFGIINKLFLKYDIWVLYIITIIYFVISISLIWIAIILNVGGLMVMYLGYLIPGIYCLMLIKAYNDSDKEDKN